MVPADGERRLISEMIASEPSARRSAVANEGGRGNEASSFASSASETVRNSEAISRRFHAMISVSLSDIRMIAAKRDTGRKKQSVWCLAFSFAPSLRFCGHHVHE